MLGLGALVMFAALAPRADAQSPGATAIAPTPVVEVDANAPLDRDAEMGLRPVSFEAKAMHASTRPVVSPDLRDPFRVAHDKPRRALRLHEDLRDPFAGTRGSTSDAPNDLRDPFGGQRRACPAVTEDGVKIQRPKSLRRPGCETARSRSHGRVQLARR